MRAAMDAGVEIPKLCATDMLDAFGSCRVCLVEIDGRGGTPASCTTPVAEGIVVKTQTERLDRHPQGRDGALRLRPSDRLERRGRHRRQRVRQDREAVGLTENRYGLDGRNHVLRPATASLNIDYMPKDESNPYFTYDPSQCIVCSRCVRACEEVQGTFALTIEGRGFESPRVGRAWRRPSSIRMRVLRRLRAGLPDRRAAREDRAGDGPADPFGGHHLRLLRRRLLVQGRDAGRRGGPHGALQGRQGQSRPFLREGPLRLGLRDPQGPHPQPDDPREDLRSLARGVAGRRRSPTSPRSSAASSTSTAAARSAASPRRAAPTRRPISCRSWCGRVSATTMSTPAPASATRRPATA